MDVDINRVFLTMMGSFDLQMMNNRAPSEGWV